MPPKNSFGRNSTYEFWLWEYQRRNQKYKTDFYQIVTRLNEVKVRAQSDMIERIKQRIKREKADKAYWKAKEKAFGHIDNETFKFSKRALQVHANVFGEEISDEDAESVASEKDKKLRDQECLFLEYEICDEFASKHGRWPTDPEKGLSHAGLLQIIREGSLTHALGMVPPRRMVVTGFGRISGENLFYQLINTLRDWSFKNPDKHFDLNILDEALILLEKPTASKPSSESLFVPYIDAHYMRIDMSQSLEVLKAALSYHYYSLKNDQQGLHTSFKQLSKETTEEPKFKSAPRTRAVGLWLWDYTRKKKVSPGAAILKFQRIFTDLPQVDDLSCKKARLRLANSQYSETPVLRRAYSEADRRIASAAKP